MIRIYCIKIISIKTRNLHVINHFCIMEQESLSFRSCAASLCPVLTDWDAVRIRNVTSEKSINLLH